MKFKFIRIKNYIGIYNGLGLHELYIDFTKCKHKKIIIKGKNGSGKSTLFDSLNVLPDSNDIIIPKHVGEKEFGIIDGLNEYHILITHPVKDNGDRAQNKAYIKKSTNGVFVELNPTGNIGSYKDVLFNEFNLDPNFVALSQISSDDRGLADKTPSERKRFINSIIEALEVYNNIYKVLNKRSSVFKAMINSITSKIDSIGDENRVQVTLNSIEDRINKLSTQKTLYIKNMTEYESMIKLIDPDLSIQKSYEEIYSTISEIDSEINTVDNNISNIRKSPSLINIELDNIDNLYKIIVDEINRLNSDIYSKELYIKNLLSDRENDAQNIQLKSQRLNSLNSEYNFIDIQDAIKTQEKNILEYESIFRTIGIDKSQPISKDEYIIGLNTLKEIKDTIDTFRSSIDNNIIQASIDYILNDSDIIYTISILDDQINNLNEYTITKTNELSYYNGLANKLSALEIRPQKCEIDDCPFISEAINSRKQDPENKIIEIIKEIEDTKSIINNTISEKSKYELILTCMRQINIIIRNIKNHTNILSKLPNGDIFSNEIKFLGKLYNNSSFNEIDELYKFIEYANIFELYTTSKHTLYTLKTDYKIYESKNEIINELSKDLEELNNKLSGLTKKIEDSRNDIFNIKQVLIKKENIKIQYEYLINNIDKINVLKSKKLELSNQFNSIKDNMIKIKDAIDNINKLNSDINNISNELDPLLTDRDKIKYSLTLLQDYKMELQEYNEKYDYIENIKYYSSPTTGIQTVFMRLYMDKTLKIANDLLALLFEGEFVLDRYIINENEFRIPCSGSGMRNDDISSMSTSQICMISMILSFSLLYQSSTKYNIIRLDEIDGGLDNNNRLQFLYVLDQLISILQVEQSIIVSHNMEANLDNVDLILLKQDGYISYNGNIIYDYNKN